MFSRIKSFYFIFLLLFCLGASAQDIEVTTKISGNFIKNLEDFHTKVKIALLFPDNYGHNFSDLKNNLLLPGFDRTLILENLSGLRAKLGGNQYQKLLETLIEAAGENSNFKLVIK